MSTFSLGRGEALVPITARYSSDLVAAIGQVGSIGGALLSPDLPEEMIHKPQEDAKLWARRVSGLLVPIIEKVYPGLVDPNNYGVEGRTQIHHRGAHFGVHQDPPYRNSIFFGFTGTGSSAEFRLTPNAKSETTTSFEAQPGTMWLLGGSKLLGKERTGGRRGGTWHELSAPKGMQDRHVSIGSIHAR